MQQLKLIPSVSASLTQMVVVETVELLDKMHRINFNIPIKRSLNHQYQARTHIAFI